MAPRIRVKRESMIDIPERLTGPAKVNVGFPTGKVGGDIVDRAIWNHYGTRGGGWGGPIPARPFLLNAIRSNRKKYLAALRKSAKKIIHGETSLNIVMNKLGILASEDVKSEITNLKTPPNSSVTIEMKGSSNPLIDTGEMRSSVTWEVDK